MSFLFSASERCAFFMDKNMRKIKLEKIFNEIRRGHSLYAGCQSVGVSTREFYQTISDNVALKEEFQLALSDYADQCMDDIRALAENLKAGELDNSTAKLLIETQKWLAQKACPEPVALAMGEDDINGRPKEIVVKFV